MLIHPLCMQWISTNLIVCGVGIMQFGSVQFSSVYDEAHDNDERRHSKINFILWTMDTSESLVRVLSCISNYRIVVLEFRVMKSTRTECICILLWTLVKVASWWHMLTPIFSSQYKYNELNVNAITQNVWQANNNMKKKINFNNDLVLPHIKITVI